jgi:hypothetical protein
LVQWELSCGNRKAFPTPPAAAASPAFLPRSQRSRGCYTRGRCRKRTRAHAHPFVPAVLISSAQQKAPLNQVPNLQAKSGRVRPVGLACQVKRPTCGCRCIGSRHACGWLAKALQRLHLLRRLSVVGEAGAALKCCCSCCGGCCCGCGCCCCCCGGGACDSWGCQEGMPAAPNMLVAARHSRRFCSLA